MPSLVSVTDEDAARGGQLLRPIESLPASREEFLRASEEESEQFSPTDSIRRRLQMLSLGEGGGSILPRRMAPFLPEFLTPEPFEGEMVSPEVANQRAEGLGLEPFTEPSPEGLVDYLITRKREENARNTILERSPGTLTSTLGIGAQFIEQAKDPINIASAFMPVVGQTRFAIWAARFGATRTRLLTGAIEGTAGAALVEPIVLSQALREQADYGFADAFLNIVFGGALGGGLHVGVGKVADIGARMAGRPTLSERVSGMPIESKERLLRSAVADMAQGRPVDVEVLFTAEELAGRARSRRAGLLAGTAAGRADDIDFGVNLGAGLQRTVIGEAQEPVLTVPMLNRRGEARVFRTRQEAENTLARLDDAQARLREMEDGRFLIERSTEAQVSREPEGAVRRFRTERAANRFKEQQGLADADVVPIGRGQGRAFTLVEGLSARDLEQARTRPEFFQPQDIARSRQQREVFAPRLEDAIRSFVERERTGRVASTSVDAEAAAEIDLRVSSARDTTDVVASAKEELAEAMDRLERAKEAAALGGEETAENFAEFDQAIEQAEAFGRAVRQAAMCEIGR